jgi:predicted ester cyclase
MGSRGEIDHVGSATRNPVGASKGPYRCGMAAEENKALLARYISEVWDKGDLEALRDFLSPGYARHTSPTLPPLDLEGQVERLHGFRQAFPDITIEVEDVVAEDDRIAFRSTMRGTHEGEFAGLAPIMRHITVGLVDIIRIEDGRFAEQWGGPDLFGMLQPLGARYTSSE